MNDGFAECCIGKCLEEDLLGVPQCIRHKVEQFSGIKPWYD